MTPVFHPAAAQELAAAAQAYEKSATGLGRDLVSEARRLISLLCDTPLIGAPLDKLSASLSPASLTSCAEDSGFSRWIRSWKWRVASVSELTSACLNAGRRS